MHLRSRSTLVVDTMVCTLARSTLMHNTSGSNGPQVQRHLDAPFAKLSVVVHYVCISICKERICVPSSPHPLMRQGIALLAASQV